MTSQHQPEDEAAILARYLPEIQRRGGETQIRTGRNSYANLSVTDVGPDAALLKVMAFRYYSASSPNWKASLAYLCGESDNGSWAVRVPGTVSTVAQALAWMEPPQVRRARQNGKRVLRQGDIYAVETTSRHAGASGPVEDTAHNWDADSGRLTHQPTDGRPHQAVTVDYPARFFQQHTMGMCRGAGMSIGSD